MFCCDGFRHRGFTGLFGGDVAVLFHDVDDALESRFRLLGVDGRIPVAGGRDDAGEHRRLGHSQVFRVLAEVRLGGGLDAVGAAAEIDGVEIVAQDGVFVLRLRDLDRQYGFLELAHVGGGLAEVIPFRVLLGDGGSALAGALGDVVDQRPCDALEIDAAVRVERAVFGGDHGLAHVFRQYGAVDDLTVLLGERADFRFAVRIVHAGFLGQRDGLRLGDFDGGVQVGERADADGEDQADDAERPLENQMLLAPFGFRAFRAGGAVGAAAAVCAFGRISAAATP